MKTIQFASFFLLVFLACSKKSPNPHAYLQISQFIPVEKHIDFSKHINGIEYIPIQESDSVYLSRLSRIYFCDDLMIIRDDKARSNKVLFFDKQGKYLFTDDHVLEGYPNNLSYGRTPFPDFTLDCENKYLYLSDMSRGHIVRYDIVTKKKEKVIDKIQGLTLHYNDGYLYVLTKNTGDGLLKVYNTSNFKKTGNFIHEIKPDVGGGSTHNQMVNYKGSVIISLLVSDTVYQSTPESCDPFIVLGDNQVTSVNFTPTRDIFESYYFDRIDKFPDMMIPIGEITMVKNIIILPMINYRYLFVDKMSKVAYSIHKENISRNNKLFSIGFFFGVHFSDGYFNGYITLTEEFYTQAKYIIEQPTHHPLKIPLKELLNEYPPERNFQNPVITRFKISEDFMEAFR